ncbi:hypothetical protein Tco_1352819 [Tanacetum coccineum]
MCPGEFCPRLKLSFDDYFASEISNGWKTGVEFDLRPLEVANQNSLVNWPQRPGTHILDMCHGIYARIPCPLKCSTSDETTAWVEKLVLI